MYWSLFGRQFPHENHIVNGVDITNSGSKEMFHVLEDNIIHWTENSLNLFCNKYELIEWICYEKFRRKHSL